MAPPGNAKKIIPKTDSPGELPGSDRSSPQFSGGGNISSGVILALIAPVIWSSSGMFIKILSLNALPLTGIRSALASMAFLPFLRSFSIRPDRNMLMLIASNTVMVLTFVMATKWTTAANAIALQATAPFWVFLLSSFISRRIVWRSLPPLLIILAGLAVILLEPAGRTTFLGNLLGALSGVAFALTSFFFSRVGRPATEVMFKINAATALILFLIQPSAFALGEIAGMEWLILVYLGGVQLGLGTFFYYTALQKITPNQGSILALLEPILNPVWVFLAIGELPSIYGFIGMGLILSGIVADGWLRLRAKHPGLYR